MDKALVASLVIIAILGGALVWSLGMGGGTGAVVGTTEAKNLNIFDGKVTTDVKMDAGEIEGVTTYDANCIGGETVECDAGIKTDEYGELNFHYSHSMETQPCLHMFGSEKVVLKILNTEGVAQVTRTIDTSKMAMH